MPSLSTITSRSRERGDAARGGRSPSPTSARARASVLLARRRTVSLRGRTLRPCAHSIFGVEPEPQPKPDTDNRLAQGAGADAGAARRAGRPRLPRARTGWSPSRGSPASAARSRSRSSSTTRASRRRTAASGDNQDNPMKNFVSFPHVMGHEVVADVVALGPEAEGLEVGDRVVLNPWLTCGPRGIEPHCPACAAGDLSQCWSFGEGRPRARDPHRDVQGRARRVRRADARARLDAVQGARTRSRTSRRCSPTRSRCRCTGSPGTRPRPGARCSSTAPARSGRPRSRSCARCTRTSR